MFYEISYNLILRNNVFRKNAMVSGKTFADARDTFPEGAVYLSEAGGDPRSPAADGQDRDLRQHVRQQLVGHHRVGERRPLLQQRRQHLERGLHEARVVSRRSARNPASPSAPLFSDCRWKTQNVDIHDNTFRFDPAKVVTARTACAGGWPLLSNFGTYPA